MDKEDFRIENNAALSYATQNHKNVIAFYIYNNNDFDNKAQEVVIKIFRKF